MGKIIVRQTGSTIAEREAARLIVRGLGLRHVGHEKTHKDNNCIRGMINKVKHLVSYKLVADK